MKSEDTDETILSGGRMNEIIVDGVNVKDCKRRTGKNSYCRYFKRPCADNNFNCIWKQCERLKAENERLKKEIRNNKSAYQVELGTYNMECGNLLEENKQLLQTLQEIKAIAEDAYENDSEYQASGVYNEIIQKITKAEEE